MVAQLRFPGAPTPEAQTPTPDVVAEEKSREAVITYTPTLTEEQEGVSKAAVAQVLAEGSFTNEEEAVTALKAVEGVVSVVFKEEV